MINKTFLGEFQDLIFFEELAFELLLRKLLNKDEYL